MAVSVSSWFFEQTLLNSAAPIRQFTMGNSDYSDFVLRWPSFRVTWDQVRAVKVRLSVANDESHFNFLQQNKLNMRNPCSLKMGYQTDSGTREMIDVFNGTVENFSSSNGVMRLSLADKFKALQEQVIGTSDEPVVFSGGTFLGSDIAWAIVTSHSGFSSLKSSSNPDINYASFLEWAEVFSSNSIFIDARFSGMRPVEALRKLARITDSAIYQEQDRIFFNRFTFVDSNTVAIDDATSTRMSVTVDDNKIVNRQIVLADYDVNSRFHRITVAGTDTGSVNSYGLREGIEKDSSMWYVNSVSAINQAQRQVVVRAEPYSQVKVETTLVGLLRLVGETVILTDESLAIVSEPFRILGRAVNMGTGRVSFDANASQLLNVFRLDISFLDGADTLG